MEFAMAATTTLLNAASMEETAAIYLSLQYLSIPTAKWRFQSILVMEFAIIFFGVMVVTTLLDADSMEGTAHGRLFSLFSSFFFQYVGFAAVSVALTSFVSP